MATPIGNLEDITLRAIRILREVDEIAAEDTRHTKKLLKAYNINTPITSLYDAVEKKRSGPLIEKMVAGKDIAYVSDAGTPGISDPGFHLIREAIHAGIRVVPVPGVSAVVAALSASGLPMHNFVFHGFLPSKITQRRDILKMCEAEKRTMVFYESPQRLKACLKDMREIMGPRRLVVARELTKIHEEFIRGTIDDVEKELEERNIKGEITLIIEGKINNSRDYSDDEILVLLMELTGDHLLSLRDRVQCVAEITGCSRKKIYQIALTGKFS
ncbi:MAG: 16S rRNA (cytidine(1402)-2'-O)-methyltransferase [Syntrophales bacterium]|nr:16S rRNA (cytidine(1402)-2'-O)-methyltransferase [Syntrophales bacterium]